MSDPQRFRVEIQFSTGDSIEGCLRLSSLTIAYCVSLSVGAKDGFGSNYALLKQHTKIEQTVFQHHLEHLLSHHVSPAEGETQTDREMIWDILLLCYCCLFVDSASVIGDAEDTSAATLELVLTESEGVETE